MHFAMVTDRFRSIGEVVVDVAALGGRYYVMHTWTSDFIWPFLTLFLIAPNGFTIQLHRVASGLYTPSAIPLDGFNLCKAGPPTCSTAIAALTSSPAVTDMRTLGAIPIFLSLALIVVVVATGKRAR